MAVGGFAADVLGKGDEKGVILGEGVGVRGEGFVEEALKVVVGGAGVRAYSQPPDNPAGVFVYDE